MNSAKNNPKRPPSRRMRWRSSAALASCLWMAAPALVSAAPTAHAKLRSRAAISASVVQLGDVAEIVAADPEQATRLGAVVLTTAPAENDVRYLRAAEIRDLAAAQGVELDGVTIDGALAVEVRRTRQPLRSEPELALRRDLTPAETAVLEKGLRDYIARKSGHDRWKIELTTTEASLDRIVDGDGRWTIAGGIAPWTGKQAFRLVGPANEPPIPIQARVTRQDVALVVLRAIDRGDQVRASDVEVRLVDGAVPPHAALSVDEAVGLEARQRLNPGALVLTSQLRSPVLVRRGETVTVVARAEGIVVKTLAVARQEGGVGDLVSVDTLDKRRREPLTARVTGRQQLEIYAAGVSPADFGDRRDGSADQIVRATR